MPRDTLTFRADINASASTTARLNKRWTRNFSTRHMPHLGFKSHQLVTRSKSQAARNLRTEPSLIRVILSHIQHGARAARLCGSRFQRREAEWTTVRNNLLQLWPGTLKVLLRCSEATNLLAKSWSCWRPISPTRLPSMPFSRGMRSQVEGDSGLRRSIWYWSTSVMSWLIGLSAPLSEKTLGYYDGYWMLRMVS